MGACTVYRLAEGARAGAVAAVWALVRSVVDIALAVVDVAAVVYVMRGAFKHHHHNRHWRPLRDGRDP